MTNKELLQDVLDAIENFDTEGYYVRLQEALRTALTQPEPAPVAWMYDWTTSDGEFIQDWTTSEAETLRDTEPNIISNIRPLYTSPPQREWVGLTKEELQEISDFHFHGAFSGREIYEDIETRLKEKNSG